MYGWFHRPSWVTVWGRLAHLGDSKFVLGLGLCGFLEAVLRRMKAGGNSQRGPSTSVICSWAGIPIAQGMTFFLKEMVHRPRPAVLLHGIRELSGEGGFSFPSGHATSAFALATALSLRWPQGKMFFFTAAFLVAVSRIALGQHWPSDVFVGAFVGCASVMVCYWIGKNFSAAKKPV